MRIGSKIRFLLCLVLAALWVLPAAAETGGGTDGKTEKKTVRVGWYESSFNQTDGLGRRSGYAYEYQIKIAAYTGWTYEYVEGSWPELLQMLMRGEIDLMSDVSFKPERAESMLFPTLPMGAEDYYLFIAPDNREISGTDYDTLNGKKIGVNQGSIQEDFYREWQERHGVESEIIELTGSEEESMKMLGRGELDGYITVDSFTAEAYAEEGRPVPVVKIGSSDFFFAVAKERGDLLSELESAMNRIREENQYYNQQMAEKYLITTGANAFLTAPEREWLEKHGTIRVGYQDNYLAFCAADPETGELTGALKDYLESAENCVMNAHIDFRATAFDTAADAIEALKRGEVDCMFPANLSAGDGESVGLFMTPSLMQTDLLAVVRQTDRQLFADRDHVIVAVNRGNPNYDSTLMDDFPAWRTVYYPTTAECLEAVSRGVADCVLISSFRYNNIARLCERLRLTTVATGKGLNYCFAVAEGHPELYSILAKVADLVPEFTVNTALSYYITEDAKTTLSDFLSEHAVIIIGIAAAMLVVLLVILGLMLRRRRADRKAALATDDSLQERQKDEKRLLNDLPRALRSYEFEVYYRPQYDIRFDPPKPAGAEPRVCWNHPELGMIPPEAFMPLLERNGKTDEVNRFVRSEAVKQADRWQEVCGVTVPMVTDGEERELSADEFEETILPAIADENNR